MGFLQQGGQNIGSWASGGVADAPGLASRSLGLGALATGADMVGNLFSGIGGMQQANFAASIARQNASAALQAGEFAGESSKLKYGALEAQQKTGAAANGISVDSGSVQATLKSTEAISALDAMAIKFNASRQAYAENTQASLDEAAGRGALAKGLLGAGTSFLSGASSLGDKWLAYKRSGATVGG